ncbi:hypothetical protein CDL12_15106 [Handroanthus impetiginosus]|uniref:Retrotransposon gag domain-containing protein n=1 Tax=Handroanthus impetiginosus TaxID=429701 RepID=A0A2G9H453_9LAMI|nr:hypothetical protein CDL12_15106 [Handroanthus impetiginosus]
MARDEFENLSEGEESNVVPDYAAQPPPGTQPGNVAAQIDVTELVAATLWFNQLPPRCIHSFSQFRDLFMHQFNNSKRFRKTSFTLYNVRQGDDELLCDYVRRFTAAVLEVPGAHKEVLANSFVNGLTEGPFFMTLVTNSIEDYDELLARAEKFINLEEAVKIKRADREKRKGKKEEVLAPKKSKPEGQEMSSSFTQQVDRFTPLKVPRSQVLMEIGASNLLKRPQILLVHNDYRHNTDECAHLRNEIEKLIEKGYLREFIADLESAPRPGSDCSRRFCRRIRQAIGADHASSNLGKRD